jgi:hypothetical protein
MRRLVVVGLVIPALVGCGGKSASTTASTEAVSESTSSEVNTVAKKPPEPGIGGAVTVAATENTGPKEVDYGGTMRIRLLSVARDASPPPYAEDVIGLKHGYKFIKVHLSLQNLGHHTEAQSGLEYSLLDADGNTRQAFDGGYEPRLGNAGTGWEGDKMQPGDRATGYIGFNVPPNFHPAHFRVVATSSEEAEPASWNLRP